MSPALVIGDSSQEESAPRHPASPLTSRCIGCLSCLSLRRRHCRSPDSSRLKVSLWRTGDSKPRCRAGWAFPEWAELLEEGRQKAVWRRSALTQVGSQLRASAHGFSFSSQEWVPVSLCFSYSALFLKPVRLSPDSPHSSTRNVSCTENLQGDKGRQAKFLRSIGCLLKFYWTWSC